MNCVTLIGHLGTDPEAHKLDSDTTLCHFRLATNRRWTKDGEKHERTDWHGIVTYGPLAEACKEYINKGSHVAIRGELRTSSWEANDGSYRRSVEIVAKDVEFLDKRRDESTATADDTPEFTDDDIPF